MLKKVVITLSLILWPLNMLLNFKNIDFSTQTVFKNDYQGEQLVLRNIHLYPTPLFARVFQNKPRIYLNKYVENFFVLIDPNNYFFALHPKPIPGNLNIFKYPLADIAFFAIGLIFLGESKHKKIIFWTLIPSILILSSLVKFEGFDFILWIPISLIIINGVSILEEKNKKLFIALSTIFILFAIPEILRSFFNH